jgi:hypothetical protein
VVDVSKTGLCTVKWELFKPDGELLKERVSEKPDFIQGPIQKCLIEETLYAMSMLPNRVALNLVCDFASFYRAFHPSYYWLDGWRKDGFRKKPPHNRGEWKTFDDVRQQRELLIDALRCEPLSDDDYRSLQELKIDAQETVNPTAQGDAPREVPLRDNTDDLYQRAIDRSD